MLHSWFRGGWAMHSGIVDIPAAHGPPGTMLLNGVAQIFGRLARTALRMHETMHAAEFSDCPAFGLQPEGVQGLTCMLAAGFSGGKAGGHTVVLLNRCKEPL